MGLVLKIFLDKLLLKLGEISSTLTGARVEYYIDTRPYVRTRPPVTAVVRIVRIVVGIRSWIVGGISRIHPGIIAWVCAIVPGISHPDIWRDGNWPVLLHPCAHNQTLKHRLGHGLGRNLSNFFAVGSNEFHSVPGNHYIILRRIEDCQ